MSMLSQRSIWLQSRSLELPQPGRGSWSESRPGRTTGNAGGRGRPGPTHPSLPSCTGLSPAGLPPQPQPAAPTEDASLGSPGPGWQHHPCLPRSCPILALAPAPPPRGRGCCGGAGWAGLDFPAAGGAAPAGIAAHGWDELTPSGKAAQAGVGVGDWVLSIDGENASALTHIEAQNRIRACGDRLSLSLSRAQNLVGKPQKVHSPDKHSLRLESPPGVPHSDSSKKRLIEDTEDWRPRTGTTQSRSFRILAQLTGTEFMQDPDDELAKKSREKFFTELQSPRYTRLRDWHHQRSATSLHV
ncbi:PDZ and LIM domain protein 5 isoform X3 [Alligator sinensis]|uniref:PDZ and LIM domain protein 5 isoform X3 n=1 Tax=Alligator sinensis TaxID=38654 RepID=A0A3Q0FJT9_ALLSI|nr:PDZ and LIM domain protein 5 isoform X3 [Alligator sinensis]